MIDLPDLNDGERIRTNCPDCGGKGTFTASNISGTIVYNCYKAGCYVSGKKETLASSNFLYNFFDEKNLSSAGKANQKSTFTFPPHWSVYFPRKMERYIEKNHIDPDKVQLYYDIKLNRAVFPIGNEDAIGRALGTSPKKWHRYGRSGLPFIVPNGNPVYVVEDAASACAVAKYGTGFALLGTNLSQKLLDILKKYPHIIVCLDRDASAKAISMKLKLSQYTKAEVRILDVDPKEKPEGVLDG